MLDYVLVVAVGISAGVGALVSAVPALQPYTLALCLAILALITIVNLRGVRESGAGVRRADVPVRRLAAGGAGDRRGQGGAGRRPAGAGRGAAADAGGGDGGAASWILMRAFASGCTAMTGVEAVSNGVTAFREPAVADARRTLTAIIAILAVMLAGIAYLCSAYHIGATEPGAAGYQSILSQLVAAVVGKGVVLLRHDRLGARVLALSANTGFADFPRLCRVIAQDGFLPTASPTGAAGWSTRTGIFVLAGLSAVLLIVFGGITDHLIPLFAVGAFLAFTLSQAGMVAHWRTAAGRAGRRRW